MHEEFEGAPTQVVDEFEKPVGVPPATLVYTGDRKHIEQCIEVYKYGEGSAEEVEFAAAKGLDFETPEKLWINVQGLSNTEEVIALCRHFGVSDMVIEDILNTPAPSKIEDHGEFIYATIKVPVGMETNGNFDIQAFCILIFERTLITLSEEKLTFLKPIYKRMKVKGKRIQKYEVDYLAWAILDIITDQIRFFMRSIEENIEELETLMVLNLKEAQVFNTYQLRREISRLQRSIRPTYNGAHHFIQMDSDLIKEQSEVYFKDLKDNISEIQELADHLLEQSTNMRELYFTMNGYKMNQAMKVLAAISVIFLPLSFLAGVFGMNFKQMPELDYSWGYPVAWLLFLLIGGTLYLLFKKKGWFD